MPSMGRECHAYLVNIPFRHWSRSRADSEIFEEQGGCNDARVARNLALLFAPKAAVGLTLSFIVEELQFPFSAVVITFVSSFAD